MSCIKKSLVTVLLICLMTSLLPLNMKIKAGGKNVQGFEFVYEVVEAIKTAKTGQAENMLENAEITEKQYTKFMKTYKISKEKAVNFAIAIKTGIVKDKVKNYKKDITLAKALGIVAKADELVYGTRVSPESIDFCIKNRIGDITNVKKAERAGEAEGYIRGFIKGSVKQYSHLRSLKGNKKVTVSQADKLLNLLMNPSERFLLSSDYQILRTKKLPRNAELYPYIVDSFPNAYYETGFNGMTNKNFFDTGVGLGADSLKERMGRTSFSFVFPYEIEEFNSLEYPCDAFSYSNNVFTDTYRNNIVPNEMVDSSEEFYRYALNVDYRTVEKNDEWLNVMRKYLSQNEIDDYIKHCKENKTIIECNLVAADRSSVYWYNGEYQCKVYAHMRIISDIPTETGKTMGTDQDIYGYLYPVKKGYESGTCFTRSVLGPLYLDYKPGEWLDYYVNTSGCADFYGSLCCTNTERSIMIDYSGLYPWLVRFPFLED